MFLDKTAAWLYSKTLIVSRILHGLGVTILALLMFLTAADVIMRYIFNRPIKGAFDLTEYMMAIIISLALAYCAVMRGNIRVEILVSHLPKRIQAIIDTITYLACLVITILIAWQVFKYAQIQFNSRVTSTVLLVPKFPFIFITGLGFASLCLALLVDFLHSLTLVMKK